MSLSIVGFFLLLPLTSGAEEKSSAPLPKQKKPARREYSRTITFSAPPPTEPSSPREKKPPPTRRHGLVVPEEDFRPATLVPPPVAPPAAPSRRRRESHSNWILPPPPQDLERSSPPTLKGWGWLADSVLSLQRYSASSGLEDEAPSRDTATELPPLLGSSSRRETQPPLSLLVPDTAEKSFSPVQDLNPLPVSRISENAPLIAGAEELGKADHPSRQENNPARKRQTRSRFSQLLSDEASPAMPSHATVSEMPYQLPAQHQALAGGLPQTEKMLDDVKQRLFGSSIPATHPNRHQNLSFRPTGDFRPSAFSVTSRREPAPTTDFLNPLTTPGAPSSGELATFGSHSLNPATSRLTIPRSLASTAPALSPGIRTITGQSLEPPAPTSPEQRDRRTRSGSPLIDKFLNLSEPEF